MVLRFAETVTFEIVRSRYSSSVDGLMLTLYFAMNNLLSINGQRCGKTNKASILRTLPKRFSAGESCRKSEHEPTEQGHGGLDHLKNNSLLLLPCAELPRDLRDQGLESPKGTCFSNAALFLIQSTSS